MEFPVICVVLRAKGWEEEDDEEEEEEEEEERGWSHVRLATEVKLTH